MPKTEIKMINQELANLNAPGENLLIKNAHLFPLTLRPEINEKFLYVKD